MSIFLARLSKIQPTHRWWFASILLHILVIVFFAPSFIRLQDGGKQMAPDTRAKTLLLTVQLIEQNANHAQSASVPAKTDVNPLRKGRLASSNPLMERADVTPPIFFHSSRELTKKPELIRGIPDVVEIPADDTVSVHVVFRLAIDRFGTVRNVSALHSTLPHDLETDLISQLYHAAYKPGEIDDVPVNSEIYLFLEIHSS